MAGILSAAYQETPVVIDIDPSTFVMVELEEEEDETPTETIPDFQPYIAQAWASFQADKAARDKGKQVRFDGVQVPPRKKPTDQSVPATKEILSPDLQQNIPPASSASCSTPILVQPMKPDYRVHTVSPAPFSSTQAGVPHI